MHELEMPEKAEDLLPISARRRNRITPWSLRLLTLVCVVALWGTLHLSAGSYTGRLGWKEIPKLDSLCPQTDQLTPIKHAKLYEEFGGLIETDSYKQRAIGWLAGAVQIPTESYDEMGAIGEDPRWEAFAPFHTYLHGAFPLMLSLCSFVITYLTLICIDIRALS
jgi:Gly-Xaa carboxypeptidase